MFAEEKNINPSQVSGVVIFDAVNAGDLVAFEVLKRYCYEIAIQIFNLQTIIDPERFAIGGGISAQPIFTETIRSCFKEMYEKCPYSVPRAEVVTCMFQNDANLVGALSCRMKEQ